MELYTHQIFWKERRKLWEYPRGLKQKFCKLRAGAINRTPCAPPARWPINKNYPNNKRCEGGCALPLVLSPTHSLGINPCPANVSGGSSTRARRVVRGGRRACRLRHLGTILATRLGCLEQRCTLVDWGASVAPQGCLGNAQRSLPSRRGMSLPLGWVAVSGWLPWRPQRSPPLACSFARSLSCNK
jgi:hypothetical protein